MIKKYLFIIILISLIIGLVGFRNYFNQQKISTIIIPHHDLVKTQRQQFLNKFNHKLNPQTIILVSLDHFESGGQNISTTNRNWNLNNKVFMSDKEKINKLTNSHLVTLQDSAFTREHGIFNVLNDLKSIFPEAKIIPLILRQRTSPKEISDLNKELLLICSKDCLLVGSIDFSHYQPSALAEIHDNLSLKALNNLDENLAFQSEVDSPAALALTIIWAKSHQTKLFVLSEHTNSGLLNNEPDIETTSYVLGWFEFNKISLVKTNQTETFVIGYQLNKTKDPRLIMGVDQKFDLANKDEVALICQTKKDYCYLNHLLENPSFYNEIINGLIVAGEIKENRYKLVLLPSDTNDHQLKRGEEKLKVINRIRHQLNLDEVVIDINYDIIEL